MTIISAVLHVGAVDLITVHAQTYDAYGSCFVCHLCDEILVVETERIESRVSLCLGSMVTIHTRVNLSI